MTTIDPRQSLAAAMQSQLAAIRERGRTRQSSAGDTARAAESSGAMAQRLGAIDPTDPDRRRKAVRIYLESEFAREFGMALLNDPAFPQMVDAVQEQMQADRHTAAAVHALSDLLLAGRAG